MACPASSVGHAVEHPSPAVRASLALLHHARRRAGRAGVEAEHLALQLSTRALSARIGSRMLWSAVQGREGTVRTGGGGGELTKVPKGIEAMEISQLHHTQHTRHKDQPTAQDWRRFSDERATQQCWPSSGIVSNDGGAALATIRTSPSPSKNRCPPTSRSSQKTEALPRLHGQPSRWLGPPR